MPPTDSLPPIIDPAPEPAMQTATESSTADIITITTTESTSDTPPVTLPDSPAISTTGTPPTTPTFSPHDSLSDITLPDSTTPLPEPLPIPPPISPAESQSAPTQHSEPRTKSGNKKWTEDDRARHGAEAALIREQRLAQILAHLSSQQPSSSSTSQPFITSRDVARMFSVSLPTASIYLRLLFKQNKLKRDVTVTYSLKK